MKTQPNIIPWLLVLCCCVFIAFVGICTHETNKPQPIPITADDTLPGDTIRDAVLLFGELLNKYSGEFDYYTNIDDRVSTVAGIEIDDKDYSMWLNHGEQLRKYSRIYVGDITYYVTEAEYAYLLSTHLYHQMIKDSVEEETIEQQLMELLN